MKQTLLKSLVANVVLLSQRCESIQLVAGLWCLNTLSRKVEIETAHMFVSRVFLC